MTKKKTVLHEEINHAKLRWDKYLDDHHFPLTRKFPGKDRRKVVVGIHRWPNNPHYHVSIKEEPNPVWDGERAEWYSTFYDDNGRGAEFSCKFFQMKNANAFIKLIWRDWFKSETHVLVHTESEFTERKTSMQKKFDRWMEKAGD